MRLSVLIGWSEGTDGERVQPVPVHGVVVVLLPHLLETARGQVPKHGVDVDVLLDGGPDEPTAQRPGQQVRLLRVDDALVQQVNLVLHQHGGDVPALVLHLHLPGRGRLERVAVHGGEGQDARLRAPVVGLGDGVELLLARRVPEHEAHLLSVQLYLALEEVHADGLLVVLGEGAFAVALDHAGLADRAVPHDHHLDGNLEVLLAHGCGSLLLPLLVLLLLLLDGVGGGALLHLLPAARPPGHPPRPHHAEPLCLLGAASLAGAAIPRRRPGGRAAWVTAAAPRAGNILFSNSRPVPLGSSCARVARQTGTLHKD